MKPGEVKKRESYQIDLVKKVYCTLATLFKTPLERVNHRLSPEKERERERREKESGERKKAEIETAGERKSESERGFR